MNKSRSWAALGQAYLSPITHFGAVIAIFWPVFLLVAAFAVAYRFYVSNLLGTLKIGDLPNFGEIMLLWVGGVAIILFTFFLLASGLVRWHRFLVLGEPARMLALLPRGRDLKYALRWLVIGILTSLIYLVLSLITAPFMFMYLSELGSTLTDPVQALPSTFVVQSALNAVLITAGTILSAVLLTRKYLFLPLVSVETPELTAAAVDHWRRPKDTGFIGGITLATVPLVVVPQILSAVLMMQFLPDVLATRPGREAIVQLMNSPSIIALNVVSGILAIYAILVLAGFLSHYYRERIRPTLEADIANAQQGQDFT